MSNLKNEILIQITSGRGPAECCWVVAQVLKLLLQEARMKGLEPVVIGREPAMENGTLYSAAVKLEGQGVAEFLQQWEGSVLWVGQSPYRRHHKRKNWFVGISRLALAEGGYMLRDHDIRYEATRAGGPGGQHVNKVSTAIRATHLPTGLSVMASDHRSQLQNKKAARERLSHLLAGQRLRHQQESIQANWQQHNELARGNPVRVFRGSDFKPYHQPEKSRGQRPAQKQEWKKRLHNMND
ncbi:peptide chain release factor H [Cesiribacter sp. SM1]|uniref:peptide chain release factor H n=1 Tax=Cesiribacter sp. SM1 TaxID=2861196 RepID=UPI001CD2E388|nr:peptide chain release factor H [Cesiribacter sp. SM1]